MLEKTKAWIYRKWYTLKRWIYSALATLGIVTMTAVALAAPKVVSWNNATLYDDGTPMPAEDIVEIRIYCDIDAASFVPQRPGVPANATPTAVSPGAAESLTHEFTPGRYSCFGTTFAANGYESQPSNVADFVVRPTVPPGKPSNFAVQ